MPKRLLRLAVVFDISVLLSPAFCLPVMTRSRCLVNGAEEHGKLIKSRGGSFLQYPAHGASHTNNFFSFPSIGSLSHSMPADAPSIDQSK